MNLFSDWYRRYGMHWEEIGFNFEDRNDSGVVFTHPEFVGHIAYWQPNRFEFIFSDPNTYVKERLDQPWLSDLVYDEVELNTAQQVEQCFEQLIADVRDRRESGRFGNTNFRFHP